MKMVESRQNGVESRQNGGIVAESRQNRGRKRLSDRPFFSSVALSACVSGALGRASIAHRTIDDVADARRQWHQRKEQAAAHRRVCMKGGGSSEGVARRRQGQHVERSAPAHVGVRRTAWRSGAARPPEHADTCDIGHAPPHPRARTVRAPAGAAMSAAAGWLIDRHPLRPCDRDLGRGHSGVRVKAHRRAHHHRLADADAAAAAAATAAYGPRARSPAHGGRGGDSTLGSAASPRGPVGRQGTAARKPATHVAEQQGHAR